MNNNSVEMTLDGCHDELKRLEEAMSLFGATSPIGIYLSRYAIIKACGTIEQAFKSLVADNAEVKQTQQIKNFLRNKVRESSMNPNNDNILKLLGSFDDIWVAQYKAQVQALPDRAKVMDSLKSLVNARNDFAHGGNPSASIVNVHEYFADARRLMEIIDGVIG